MGWAEDVLPVGVGFVRNGVNGRWYCFCSWTRGQQWAVDVVLVGEGFVSIRVVRG